MSNKITSVAAFLLGATVLIIMLLFFGMRNVEPAQSPDLTRAYQQRQTAPRDVTADEQRKWLLKVDQKNTAWLSDDAHPRLPADVRDAANGPASADIPPRRSSGLKKNKSRPILFAGAPSNDALPEAGPVPVPQNIAQATGLDPQGAFEIGKTFAQEINRKLVVPLAAQTTYGVTLENALQQNKLGETANEYVLLVDRSINVQALFIYYRENPHDTWKMLGATPVSTGLPGTYDHFVTPLGVFEHKPSNMDYRSEGTLNEYKIRGYGARDMRIYDFGWAQGERGWGKGGMSQMRFQMHATDPDKLEPVLGVRHSKGCVRIPAALNVFLDNHGVLDADYEAKVASGQPLWILKPRRTATPWAGHYLVVVDSAQTLRPSWSPLPTGKARSQFPAHGDTAD
jgi:hypothetical protein